MDLILENLPEHWEDAKNAARNLEFSVKEQREAEKADRKIKKERERAERDKLREDAEQAKLKIEVIQDEGLEIIPKKLKTKVVTTKDENGWVKQKRVFDDEEGNERVKITKSQPEEKPHKVKKVRAEPPPTNLNNNIFVIADESESLPSVVDYQSSLREAKVKAKPEKTPVKPKPARKPAEAKEKEKEKEKEVKKPAAKVPKVKADNKKQLAADVPLWQNDLFKPLVYVFGLVSLLSLLYLFLN
jgi:hypothetical protein